MCRLFGLIANKEVDIKFSFLEANNALKFQSKQNPHGWGIGWYEKKIPKVEKYGENAFLSQRFVELVKEVKSQIIIAHVRYASSGSAHSDKNAHPFIYNKWIFAHNGTINKEKIYQLLVDPYKINFTSEPIDSEVYFRFVIQCVEEKDNLLKGLRKAVIEVTKDCEGANFILSDGENLYAFKFGRDLYYLVRDFDAPFDFISKETKAIIESKKIANEKAILIATEKITKQENWILLEDGEFLIIDKNLKVRKEMII